MEQPNEHGWAPYPHIIRGQVNLAQGRRDDAPGAFQTAHELADGYDLPLFGLRTAVHLARLMDEQDGRAQAIELQRPIYRSFTERFDTADLLIAKALLGELTSDGGPS